MPTPSILVYMSDCLLGHGLSCLLTYQYGFEVNHCIPSDIHIAQAIEETSPKVIILNQETEETDHSFLPQILSLQTDLKVLVINGDNNFLHIIDHKYHQLCSSAEFLTITQLENSMSDRE